MRKINSLILKAKSKLGQDKAFVMAFVDRVDGKYIASINRYNGKESTTQEQKAFKTEQELENYLQELSKEYGYSNKPMTIYKEYGLED